jgi:hypothetical protein
MLVQLYGHVGRVKKFSGVQTGKLKKLFTSKTDCRQTSSGALAFVQLYVGPGLVKVVGV